MTSSDNLFSVADNFFSPDIIQKISAFIEQSVEKTKTGLNSIIPVLISGIVDKGSTQKGATNLVEMLSTKDFKTIIKSDANKLSENNIIKNIFGNNLNKVVSQLENSTGLAAPNVTKILEIAAPVFMGFLESKVKNEKLNSIELMNFLRHQKKKLQRFPPGTSEYSLMVNPNAQEISWSKIGLGALVLFFFWFLFWWAESWVLIKK